MKYIAGIEAGGTKIFITIGTDAGKILENTKVDTTTPDEVMPKIVCLLKKYYKKYKFESIGVACFGPIDPIEVSKTYGFITSTPKVLWTNFHFLAPIKAAFPNTPIAFDTDVNGAILAEYYWGAAQKNKNAIYLTIGTGIGGGAIINGDLLHGIMHPEMGHIMVNRHSNDKYEGKCPYHKACLEGLAAGPAILERWNVNSALELPENHPAWDMEAHYIATALATLLCCFSTEKFILGGGVMKQKQLFPMIRKKMKDILNNYIQNPSTKCFDHLVVQASFGDNTGVLGSIALGMKAAN